MPPSGFSRDQSSGIESFLRSCAEALEAEADALNQDYRSALTRECESIQVALPDYGEQPIACAVLTLTMRFYETVLRYGAGDQRMYWSSVERALTDAERQVLGVHVAAPEL
jgi:hypothetical protein